MTSKVTDDGTNDTEHVDYEYNLQGRLKQITTTPYDGSGNPTTPVVTTQYKYNPQGIRVEKSADGVLTKYLIDPYNHTGYAQVLEETTGTGANLTRIQYTLGDDVISQTESTSTDSGANWTPSDTEYLLYDGHGSTRQLADDAGAILTDQNFSYDAYGVMLSDGSGKRCGRKRRHKDAIRRRAVRLRRKHVLQQSKILQPIQRPIQQNRPIRRLPTRPAIPAQIPLLPRKSG